LISKHPALLRESSFEKLFAPQLSSSVTNLEDDNNGIFFMIDRNQYGITYQLTGINRRNHIWVYNALVSLGYNYSINNSTFGQRFKYKIHNIYNRIRAIY